MIKSIFTQLWNRRKANSWIFVELMMVFCLLWYITDYFFVLEYNKSIPSCRDLRHTWQIQVAQLPAEHPDYQPAESDSTALRANFDRVLDRIRLYKDVESMAIFSNMCTPGGGNYWGNEYRNSEDTTRTASGQMIAFDPQTDFFKVFRYTTNDGQPVSVADFDWTEPRMMVVGEMAWRLLSAEGQQNTITLEGTGNKEDGFLVKGVVGDTKRFDYKRPQVVFFRAQRLNDENVEEMEIAVRSNEAVSDARFREAFQETMSRELRIGNFYLKGLQSYEKINSDTDYTFGVTNNIRIRTAMLLFFLVNIILCVMGTFWYRIRVRREEIGLRMAMGSTRAGIRRLLLSEGIVLLVLASIPALLIESQFVYLGMIDTPGVSESTVGAFLPDRTFIRFLITNCITWILLSIAILIAIWLPADKASKMAPADALHYE